MLIRQVRLGGVLSITLITWLCVATSPVHISLIVQVRMIVREPRHTFSTMVPVVESSRFPQPPPGCQLRQELGTSCNPGWPTGQDRHSSVESPDRRSSDDERDLPGALGAVAPPSVAVQVRTINWQIGIFSTGIVGDVVAEAQTTALATVSGLPGSSCPSQGSDQPGAVFGINMVYRTGCSTVQKDT